MKVLYLLPQPKVPTRIGAYTFLDEEVRAMAAAGIDAYVLTTVGNRDRDLGAVHMRAMEARATVGNRLRAGAHLLRRVNGLPLRSVRYPLRCYRSTWAEHVAASVVKEEGIDLIHSHFAWPQGLGGAFARGLTARPLVASLRGTDILVDPSIGYGRSDNAYFSRSLGHLLATADRTIYFSRFMRDRGVSLGARPEATRVVRKGVDLTHFAPTDDRRALRQSLGLPDRPMLLTVGGLIARKGIHHVLGAAARLRPEHDFTFVVCGDGPDLRKLTDLAAQLGIGDRVVFTGRVDRTMIPKYFAACDVFVLASTMEAAGNVLFEAMASARPVVCTDAGGPGEYIVDGETGYVVPVGDEAGLADRIGSLLRDPARADRLGEAGRRRSLDQFDYARMVDDLIAVYREVV